MFSIPTQGGSICKTLQRPHGVAPDFWGPVPPCSWDGCLTAGALVTALGKLQFVQLSILQMPVTNENKQEAVLDKEYPEMGLGPVCFQTCPKPSFRRKADTKEKGNQERKH